MCLKINDDKSSSITSISFLIQQLGILKSLKNSTDLSNEFKTAIGCEPSTMLCRKVEPDVAAKNSKHQFKLGFKTTSSFTFKGDTHDI